ncbi:MAG: NAD-dependent epimerase/dehydratase family protein [Terriglobales bacterium]
MNWRDETVFVTGATGFIGGRVCERLMQSGVRRVRALVHGMHRASRIARMPVELCPGDLQQPESLRQALGDAKVVIHCGLGPASTIVRGTENMLATAHGAAVKRFIHISTAAVYGITPPPGSERENAPLRRTGDPYCDNKAAAEKVVLDYGKRGLPVVILRPSIVWGPYSAWSTRLIEDLRAGHVAFIDGGRGACNTTYVDNLVDAMFFGLENDRGLNDAFFITDGERVTWGDFIRAHMALIDPTPEVREISRAEIEAGRGKTSGLLMGSVKATARVARSKEFRQMLMQVPLTEAAMKKAWNWVGSLPPEKRERLRSRFGVRRAAVKNGNAKFIPDAVTEATQSATVFFSIEKARTLLGYEPRVHFADGMKRVGEWLRYAAYL